MKCRVEHEKRNSISTSNHVLFCSSCKHNSTPHGKVELINENRKIDNPRLKIVKCVALKMKNALNHYKNNNGPNLNKQNSQLLNLSSAIEEVFQVHS